jgi:ABC-2 type transport system permease protein
MERKERKMPSLLLKELRAHLGGIIGWTLGLGLWGLIATVLFPSIGEQFGDMQFPEFYEAFGPIGAIGELSGFLSLEVFGFAVPIALGIYALVLGTAVLAGEEDDGTLELLITLPLPRWKLVLAKALSIALSLAIVALGLCLSIWVGIQVIEDQIQVAVSWGDLAIVALQSWLLVAALAMISLFLGAYLPSRRHAAMVGGLVLAGSYLLDSLAQITDALNPFRPLSLNYYYDSRELMASGLAWQDTAVLVAVMVVFLALSLLSFRRRNVTVGAWPWQRPRVSLKQ